ncbi:MAG: hydantoinase/oxoprolinase family protein [Armatimonadetes bacterium]|nr:hydantoinase/oxoprolinase family protein [Armatimonadota bacterium]
MTLSLGVDVGGTHTDAVAARDGRVLAWAKRPTSADVASGVASALQALLAEGVEPADVGRVCVGTTHFTNAVLERSSLSRTAVIRLCRPAGTGIPPFSDWPAALRTALDGGSFMISGGLEHDGRLISSLRPEELESVAGELRDRGIKSAAVCGIFANLDGRQELEAASRLKSACPGLEVTVSHEIGRTGLLERENASILNACLVPLARRVLGSLAACVRAAGLRCPVFVSRNNGSLMSCETAARYPIQTFASGPTNSIRGAAVLAGIREGLVLDIGGTSSDLGALVAGYPRPASFAVSMGGVRTNFQLPDILSLPLGGGSLVRGENIGPESVGCELERRAISFGGPDLTATDLAVVAGLVSLGSRRPSVPPESVARGLKLIHGRIREAVERMRTGPQPVRLVAVGGAAFLVPDELPGVSEILRPALGPVANAVGAATARVLGEVDRIVSLESMGREQALETVVETARKRAVAAGADPRTLEVVEVEEIPLAYLPGTSSRFVVRVEGRLE